MSIDSLSKVESSALHHISHPCPFRIRHSPVSVTLSSLSWCAHHDFSDNKDCNIHKPCNVISTIVNDPSFEIQTAMLWIRSGNQNHGSDSERALSAQAVPTVPSIQLNDDKGIPIKQPASFIQEDKPDLGLMPFHRDRLVSAARAFGWCYTNCLNGDEQALNDLKAVVENHMEKQPPIHPTLLEMRKVRIRVNRSSQFVVDSNVIGVYTAPTNASLLTKPFMPSSLDDAWQTETPLCRVYLDTKATQQSVLTEHKTMHRCVYNNARERANLTPTTPPTSAEVLLYNPMGEITEASFSTVYFKRNNEWMTPAKICGPNVGVSRELAIKSGLAKSDCIEIRDLREGEQIWLSNAVRGFFKGIIATSADKIKELEEGKEVTWARSCAGGAGNGYGKAMRGF